MSRLSWMLPIRRLAVPFAALTLSAACGGAGAPAPRATPTASATATATPAPTSAPSVAGSLAFQVASASKAVVRVNEQLADHPLPSDAVLTASPVTGSFTLLADGTFSPDSKISVDLSTLTSDQRGRDGTIKRSVLETSRFPDATFVPTNTSGLALPLADNTDLDFTVTGQMTIHGVTKEVSFAATGKKTGATLEVVANATPAFTFGQFGMTQPRVFTVISIKDEIRLEVDLVATQQT